MLNVIGKCKAMSSGIGIRSKAELKVRRRKKRKKYCGDEGCTKEQRSKVDNLIEHMGTTSIIPVIL